jgi:hypothetical protein
MFIIIAIRLPHLLGFKGDVAVGFVANHCRAIRSWRGERAEGGPVCGRDGAGGGGGAAAGVGGVRRGKGGEPARAAPGAGRGNE